MKSILKVVVALAALTIGAAQAQYPQRPKIGRAHV